MIMMESACFASYTLHSSLDDASCSRVPGLLGKLPWQQNCAQWRNNKRRPGSLPRVWVPGAEAVQQWGPSRSL